MKYLTPLLVALSICFAAPAGATENVLACGPHAGVATTVTSCPFANNVARAFFAQGPGDVIAYSPVTGSAYDMWCTTGWTITVNTWPWNSSSAARCVGGDDAVVWVW